MKRRRLNKERIEYLKNRLALYREAEEVLLTGGQEWSIGNQKFKRADLEAIVKRIASLESELAREERGGGIRVQLVEPH